MTKIVCKYRIDLKLHDFAILSFCEPGLPGFEKDLIVYYASKKKAISRKEIYSWKV